MATGGDSKGRQAATHGDARRLDVAPVATGGDARRLAAATHGDVRRLVATREAATFLGLSVASLRHKVSRGQVPVVRLGRTVRFDLDTLAELARSTSTPAKVGAELPRLSERPRSKSETEDERLERQFREGR